MLLGASRALLRCMLTQARAQQDAAAVDAFLRLALAALHVLRKGSAWLAEAADLGIKAKCMAAVAGMAPQTAQERGGCAASLLQQQGLCQQCCTACTGFAPCHVARPSLSPLCRAIWRQSSWAGGLLPSPPQQAPDAPCFTAHAVPRPALPWLQGPGAVQWAS